MPYSIEAEQLEKTFTGKLEVRALDGVSFSVAEGTVFGLLGPNGSGKTTAVRILTTILRADGGRARVLGHDVAKKAGLVRSLIGLAGQYAAVDENLTGRENLEMVGNLNHLRRSTVAGRAQELLVQFDLADAGDRTLKTYSGGMRRRLDLAAALVARPIGALPRRAHHRARPAEPQRPVGGDRAAGRGRDHRPAHHPVPRGGGPAGRHPGRSSTTAGSSPKGTPTQLKADLGATVLEVGLGTLDDAAPDRRNCWRALGSHTSRRSTAPWSRSRWTTVPKRPWPASARSTRRGSSPPRSPCASRASTTSSWPSPAAAPRTKTDTEARRTRGGDGHESATRCRQGGQPIATGELS